MKNICRLIVISCFTAGAVGLNAAGQTRDSDAGRHASKAASVDGNSGPNYVDTVRYIQEKIADAGYPTPDVSLNGVVGKGLGVAYTATYDEAKYTFSVNGCESMTISSTVGAHSREYSNDDRTWHSKAGQMVASYTVPFKSVANYPELDVPAVFSTYDPKTSPLTGTLFADGYPIQAALDVMISQLPPSKAIERGTTPDHQDWHDAVWVVPKDLDVSWSSSGNGGDEPTSSSGHILRSGLPVLMIRFAEPGKGATSEHVAKAIQHLVDVCLKHPDQGPKELF